MKQNEVKSQTTDQVKHQAKVLSSDSGIVRLELLVESACRGCHHKDVCMASDEKTKVIEVPDTRQFSVGSELTLAAHSQLGGMAMMLAYVAPIAVVLSALFIFQALAFSELEIGLYALLSLVPYLVLLKLLQPRLKRIFTFYIEA